MFLTLSLIILSNTKGNHTSLVLHIQIYLQNYNVLLIETFEGFEVLIVTNHQFPVSYGCYGII